jgi:hypothetical protein
VTEIKIGASQEGAKSTKKELMAAAERLYVDGGWVNNDDNNNNNNIGDGTVYAIGGLRSGGFERKKSEDNDKKGQSV